MQKYIPFTLLLKIALLTYVPYKLYKIIDNFADDINPYNFSNGK